MTDQNRATTTYTASGRRQVTQETFFVDTVTYQVVRNTDPAAQTFAFNDDSLVTSVGIFFATKDVVPVVLQLRNVVNGYPGPIAYASKILQPQEVSVSNDGSTETKFVFDDPVLCNRDTQYCVVLLTEGTQYRLWVANMGEKDVATGDWVPAQPFLGGTFFSSNDNQAWTAHQEIDMKFKIYVAQFDDNDAVLNFNKVSGIEAARFVLTANQLIPSGTSVKWEVSQDGINNWIPVDVNGDALAFTAKWSDCYIRATLSGVGKSPIINMGTVVATGIKFKTVGKYINRLITTLSNFTKVNIWADLKVPAGCSVTPKFSINDGASWVDATEIQTYAAIDPAFTQHYYQNTVASSNQFRIDFDITGTEADTVEIRRLMVTLV